MRTGRSRVRRLLALLVVAVSVGWLLLRRRTGSALPLPATAPMPPGAPPPAAPAMATVAAPEVLATDAGLTAAPAAPALEPLVAAAPVGPEVLATDAGLTAAPQSAVGAEPVMAAEAAGPDEDTMVLPQVVEPGAPAAAGTDNLRAIRGIGPAMERTLRELGITTYQQVADLRGEQPEAVRHRVEALSARIEREDWIGQAQELHRRKYGG